MDTYEIYIALAGKKIKIYAENILPDDFFADFQTTETEYDCVIYLTENDLLLYQVNGKIKTKIIEENILRKVSETLIDQDVFLIHGASIGLNNSAYLFCAPSGTGKTTHCELWKNRVPGFFFINGDKPFIATDSGGKPPMICGSPWAGKEKYFTNAMVPLKSIIFMERSEHNQLNQISFAEAFPFLLQQTYRPKDTEKMRKTIKLLQRLKHKNISFYRFKCNNFDADCFEVAYMTLVD